MSYLLKLAFGVASAATAAYLLRDEAIVTRGGVRRFSEKARKAALDALVNTSLDSANIPGEFAMHVTALNPEGVPTMRMIAESHEAGLNTFASDSILDLSSGSVGLVVVTLIIADPTEAPRIAGPNAKFAELVAVNVR